MFCTLYGVWGNDFHRKIFKFYKKKFHFFFIKFFKVITASKTLNGRRNIQGFALIRAVLFLYILEHLKYVKTFPLMHTEFIYYYPTMNVRGCVADR